MCVWCVLTMYAFVVVVAYRHASLNNSAYTRAWFYNIQRTYILLISYYYTYSVDVHYDNNIIIFL
jgi:hypothetical protein